MALDMCTADCCSLPARNKRIRIGPRPAIIEGGPRYGGSGRCATQMSVCLLPTLLVLSKSIQSKLRGKLYFRG